ncbi:MAG: family 78 glycoside hydrolase catalytic domain, partial [Clostridia bacterium]|nr:family 78 glycoside hydrolase catalytic domain [Clostridia bacterium]
MTTPAFRVYDCTINDLHDPCGLDSTPLFSFKLDSAQRGDEAMTRCIRISEHHTGKRLWDSGTVHSTQQLYIPYEGGSLQPLTRYDYAITVTARSGHTAGADGSFVTGKLGTRWSARWITDASVRREPDTHGAQYLRKTFDVKGSVASAYLVICGLGYFESYLNGQKTGDDVLSPAFTRYDAEAQYLVYDVTGQLHTGINALGVMLGNGWYNCFTEDAWNIREASWRHLPKLLCELHITYADGTDEIIRSDLTWKAAKGPIVFNSIRNGEYYDARLELGAWTTTDYDDSAWGSVKLMKSPGGLLKAMEMEPIRLRAVHPAVKMWKSRDGYIFDVGQNQAGVGQFTLRGKAGTAYRFRYAEELTPDGELNTVPIAGFTRSGEFQTDKYIKKSDAPETWYARFTYHGFRYIEVTGMEYTPELCDVCARTYGSDVADAGFFDCSSETLRGTQHMSRWATLSNMHSSPTDDPHREKNGWIGDVSMSCEQMLMNFGTRAFLSKW